MARWRRQLRHHFAAGEQLEAAGQCVYLGGNQRRAGLMFVSTRALYVPGSSADVVIPYDELRAVEWTPGDGPPGNGFLRLELSTGTRFDFAIQAPPNFSQLLLEHAG